MSHSHCETFLACFSLKEGRYERKPIENDWHYVDIKKMSNGNYKWRNKAYYTEREPDGEWRLIPITGKCNKLQVGIECPYSSYYKIAEFDQDGIFGPFDEYYSYECNFDRCSPFGDK